MALFKHILFPVHYSDQCEQTAVFVKDMAKRTGAKVSVLHVSYPPMPLGSEYGAVVVQTTTDIDEIAEARLRDFARHYLLEGVGCLEVGTVSRIGDAALEIVKYSKETDVDLIMLPTHGYGRFRRLLLGSVTAKVLHDAECAVWTTPHAECHPEFRPGHVRYILGAVGLGAANSRTIQTTCDLSRLFAGRASLVHVLADYFRSLDVSGQAAIKVAAKHKIDGLQGEAGTNFDVAFKCGPVSESIREAALECKADIVVTIRPRLHGHIGFRENVYSIIRDAPCPVLTI